MEGVLNSHPEDERVLLDSDLLDEDFAATIQTTGTTTMTEHSENPAASSSRSAQAPTATQAVRSAKDAINAMYATQPSPQAARPVASAKDAINAAAQGQAYGASSAANLHKHSGGRRQVESVRPSASGLLRTAQSSRRTKPRLDFTSADPLTSRRAGEHPVAGASVHQAHPEQPIIRTSLKLGPKKPPLVMKSRTAMGQSSRDNGNVRRVLDPQLRPRKGQTRLMQDMVRRRPSAPSAEQSAVNAIKAAAFAATQNTAKKSSAPRPAHPETARVFQDVIRPARTAASPAAPSAAVEPEPTPQTASAEKKPKTAKGSKLRPLDSIKNRFRPAPKGYGAPTPEQARPNRPHQLADFQNPTHSESKPAPAKPKSDSILAQGQAKETIHFYGMTEGPEKPDSNSPWNVPVPDLDEVQACGLGVVEDYQSQGDSVIDEQISAAKASQSAPDNNRYALGGQSPFFLKSVKVEKRPLSDASPRPSKETENPIYAAQKIEQTPKKNVYEKTPAAKNTKDPKKSRPAKPSSRPTVIIPSRRRSHTPMVALLILTVVLGAIVGGAAYIFFFQ